MGQAIQAVQILFFPLLLLLAVDEELVGQTLLELRVDGGAADQAIHHVVMLVVTETHLLLHLLKEIMVEAALLPVHLLVVAVVAVVVQVR